ncbi:FKBP-type peptidyl-prolyl cis-trans isomerase N-terminal domain-containing protein [Serratia sp. TSA_198.1]|uniref:FKBP-type peptidyl-prolyl cis-trans isomerase N-terminal domain-containing protein n=1 Tax=Serratia sp. TSA_198.1 TaxID=3415664 RepID=UPI00404566DD
MISCSRQTFFSLMLPLMAASGALYADDGVPVLLQFAEQYHQQGAQEIPVNKQQPTQIPVQKPTVKVSQVREPAANQRQQLMAVHKTLREKEAQLERQQAAIQSLQQELTALRVASTLTAPTTAPSQQDFTALSEFASGVRQALNLTPTERQAQALIAEAHKTMSELQVQLTQLQDKNRKQAKQLEDNGLQLAAALEENAKSAQQFEQVSKRASEAEQERVAGNQVEKRLRKEIDDLRSRATLLPDKLMLTKPQEQQSYAAGVALGRDIQTLLAERKTWGIDPDKTTLLGGMIDTFNGHYQLSEAVLASALAESEKTVNAGRTKAAKDQQAKGESFVSEFRKKKGAKKSSAGFWFRVDYLGDEAIAETSLVDIVVKEMLTDGRVIQDMDRSGKVLSQPLSAYPPLFREAIGYLRNHGSLTMVVPPELAYGEAGYAPQIPPNATMVYELRVVDADKG